METVVTYFGRGRLIRALDGRLELRGGSPSDRTAAKEWISLFMPECVLSGGCVPRGTGNGAS